MDFETIYKSTRKSWRTGVEGLLAHALVTQNPDLCPLAKLPPEMTKYIMEFIPCTIAAYTYVISMDEERMGLPGRSNEMKRLGVKKLGINLSVFGLRTNVFAGVRAPPHKINLYYFDGKSEQGEEIPLHGATVGDFVKGHEVFRIVLVPSGIHEAEKETEKSLHVLLQQSSLSCAKGPILFMVILGYMYCVPIMY